MSPVLEIVDPGPLTTVQDLGRPGYAALGAPRSGAFDADALRTANRLVGNAESAAGLECVLGGLRVRTSAAVTIALTGAVCAGAPAWGAAVTVPAGTQLHLSRPPTGLRSYLAVRGGVAVPATLGSRSSDTLSGLGPAPLRAGDRVAVSPAAATAAAPSGESWVPRDPPAAHRIVLGPRSDWFTADAVAALLDAVWTVADRADRVGVRLDGPALRHARDAELPSEPALPGALQVPPDGRPIVFGPDAPVTGGYPVIAVLRRLDPVAQLRPGDTLRFTTR